MAKRIGMILTERQEHLALMEWVAYQPWKDFFIHIANEYDGGSKGGHIRKLMGVRAGVSDFFLPIPTPAHHGLWIELKRMGGSVTPLQKKWLNSMQLLGYQASVCYGCMAAIRTISDYLCGISLPILKPHS